MSIWQSPGTTGIIRRNNIPGTTSCIFTYSSQDTRTLQNGLDIVPAVVRCRNGINVPIPDLSNARDSVQVSIGSGCTVFDVDVVIDTLIHTFVSDMVIYLRKGPVGVRIFNRSGGGGDNFIGTIFDDEAPVNVLPPPFTGRFRPNTPLAPFDSQATDGYWRLHITDTVGGDSGFLRAWCVAISYRCPTGGIQTVEIPNHYILKQNYPNPFNPETSIKYGLPKGQLVKLVVFDVLGREVVTLVNEFKPPGVYEANFDASNYASGIYFYKLETADFAETKKMILIK
jgi:subtilisin-like proprotein convertase family protein